MIAEITELHDHLGEIETMQVQDLGVSVVVAPHPDDETLGCGGTVALLRNLNIPVHFIFVSDGTMSHPNSLKFPEEKLRRIREDEAEKAVLTLGGDKNNISFLRIKDTRVPYRSDAGFEKAVQQMVQIIGTAQPQTVFVPWQKDPHRDHQATWEIMSEVCRRLDNKPRILEYPIWFWELGQAEDLDWIVKMKRVAVDITTSLNIKNEALRAHVSQVTGMIDDDPDGFMLSAEVMAHFNIPTEVFFESEIQTNNMGKPEKSLDADFFNKMYAQNQDPWDFENSPYEREKYQATLDVIPNEKYKNVFEIGCSNGVLTQKLLTICQRLLAVDASEIAVKNAKDRLADYPFVEVKEMTIPKDFPEDKFDLILFSEVGYFLTIEDLTIARDRMVEALLPEGHLLMVHWTPPVQEFPLTGDQVHELFMESASLESSALKHLYGKSESQYRIDLFEKI